MKYAKPELIPVGNPLEVVRHHIRKGVNCEDSDGSGDFNATCNAYEADE